jgi:hypothetical protein
LLSVSLRNQCFTSSAAPAAPGPNTKCQAGDRVAD